MAMAEAVRIRDNQRRSRARRKEYIQELEERLRKFERLGTQATIEVQTAARKVSEQNTLLRSLLRLHGVSDVEVEGYLRRDSSGVVPFALEARDPSYNAATMQSDRAFLRDSTDSHKHPAPGLPPRIENLKEPYQEIERDRVAPIKDGGPLDRAYLEPPWPDFRYSGSHNPHDPRPKPTSGPRDSQTRAQCSHAGKDNTKPCEEAAGIIANMRGHNNTEAARAELGCVSGSSCVVKNITIFQALDR